MSIKGSTSKSRNDNTEDSVKIDIPEIQNWPYDPHKFEYPTIFKVPDLLRKLNGKAYTPQLVSIGPFHYGEGSLKGMQSHKEKYYLNKFLNRTGKREEDLLSFIHDQNSEGMIESKYAGAIQMCREQFEKVMLTDACFIFELFFLNCDTFKMPHEDYILRTPLFRETIKLDLIMNENQIPFYFLKNLYDHIVFDLDRKQSFLRLCLKFFKLDEAFDEDLDGDLEKHTKHFTDLYKRSFVPSHSFVGGKLPTLYSATKIDQAGVVFTPSLKEVSKWKKDAKSKQESSPQKENSQDAKSKQESSPQKENSQDAKSKQESSPQKENSQDAKSKQESSPQKENSQDAKSKQESSPPKENSQDAKSRKGSLPLTDIDFSTPSCWHHFITSLTSFTLQLPSFTIDDQTECIMRNIMAMEQCQIDCQGKGTVDCTVEMDHLTPICDYIYLMNELIDTEQDVDLLVEKGVIINRLGSTNEVMNMMNKLSKNISMENFVYTNVFERLREFYKNPYNRTKATLRRVYFKDLWTGSSSVVAVFIVMFMAISTIEAIWSIKEKNS